MHPHRNPGEGLTSNWLLSNTIYISGTGTAEEVRGREETDSDGDEDGDGWAPAALYPMPKGYKNLYSGQVKGICGWCTRRYSVEVCSGSEELLECNIKK